MANTKRDLKIVSFHGGMRGIELGACQGMVDWRIDECRKDNCPVSEFEWQGMKIESNYNRLNQLATFTVKGKIDFHALLSSINHAFADSDQIEGYLWDLRHAKGGQRISLPQIAQFYSLCGNHFYKVPSRYVAFLVSEEIGFGLAQVMSTFEELYDVYLNVRVFKNYEEALAWLNQNADESGPSGIRHG